MQEILTQEEINGLKKYVEGNDLYEWHYKKIEDLNEVLTGERTIYDGYNARIRPEGFIERYAKFKNITLKEAHDRIGTFILKYHGEYQFPSAPVVLTRYSDGTPLSIREGVEVKAVRFGYPDFNKAAVKQGKDKPNEADKNTVDKLLDTFKDSIEQLIVENLIPKTNRNVIPINFPYAFIRELPLKAQEYIQKKILQYTADKLKHYDISLNRILFISKPDEYEKISTANQTGIKVLNAVDMASLGEVLHNKGYAMVDVMLAESTRFGLMNGGREEWAFNGKEENNTRANPELALMDDFNRYSIIKQYYPTTLDNPVRLRQFGIEGIHRQMERQQQKEHLEKAYLRIFPTNEAAYRQILRYLAKEGQTISEIDDPIKGKFIEIRLNKSENQSKTNKEEMYRLSLKCSAKEIGAILHSKTGDNPNYKYHIEYNGQISNFRNKNPNSPKLNINKCFTKSHENSNIIYISQNKVFGQHMAKPLPTKKIRGLKDAAIARRKADEKAKQEQQELDAISAAASATPIIKTHVNPVINSDVSSIANTAGVVDNPLPNDSIIAYDTSSAAVHKIAASFAELSDATVRTDAVNSHIDRANPPDVKPIDIKPDPDAAIIPATFDPLTTAYTISVTTSVNGAKTGDTITSADNLISDIKNNSDHTATSGKIISTDSSVTHNPESVPNALAAKIAEDTMLTADSIALPAVATVTTSSTDVTANPIDDTNKSNSDAKALAITKLDPVHPIDVSGGQADAYITTTFAFINPLFGVAPYKPAVGPNAPETASDTKKDTETVLALNSNQPMNVLYSLMEEGRNTASIYIENISSDSSDDKKTLGEVINKTKGILKGDATEIENNILLLLLSLKSYSMKHKDDLDAGGKRAGYGIWYKKEEFQNEITVQGKRIFGEEFKVTDPLLMELKKISSTMQKATKNYYKSPTQKYFNPKTNEEIQNISRSFRIAQLIGDDAITSRGR